MNIEEFENKMRTHAAAVKDAIVPPFIFEREEHVIMKTSKKFVRNLLVIAAAVCVAATAAVASFKYLSAREVVEDVGYPEVAKLFDNGNYMGQTVSDAKYEVTVLGIATGKNLDSLESDLDDQKDFIVVAVDHVDGTPMTFDEGIGISPVVEGFAPWTCNVATLHGGYSEELVDGTLYRFIECDSVSCFADRQLYIAVFEGIVPDAQKYSFDAQTGKISPVNGFDGNNMLIEFDLDDSMADPQRAADVTESLLDFSGEISPVNDFDDTDMSIEFDSDDSMADPQ